MPRKLDIQVREAITHLREKNKLSWRKIAKLLDIDHAEVRRRYIDQKQRNAQE